MKITTITTITTTIGAGIMLFKSGIGGFLFMIGGLIVGVIFCDDLEPVAKPGTYYTPEPKEPYYKDEFEKNQHFKNVSKSIYREQVKSKIAGTENPFSPEKDAGLFNSEKAKIWKEEFKKRDW